MKYYEWKEMEEIFKLLEAEGMNPRRKSGGRIEDTYQLGDEQETF